MEQIFRFNEEENVKDVSLELLSQSLMITDAKGQPPKNRPIQSWELIQSITDMATAAKLDVEVAHIYVPKKDSTPVIRKEEKELYSQGDNIPIGKWLFNKLAVLIKIHHPQDTDTVTALAASYHDKGIQIVWGQNVNVCSNMCVFGGNTVHTFGEERMPFEKIQEILHKWIGEFEIKRALDLSIIRAMKEHVIDEFSIEHFLDAMVGRMYRNAVKCVYLGSGRSVFNITQCSSFVQEMEQKLTEYRERLVEYDDAVEGIKEEGSELLTPESLTKPVLTLWEIYNWGTEILKPENTDVANVYQVAVDWGKFLMDYANFDPAKATEEVELLPDHHEPLAEPVSEDTEQTVQPAVIPEAEDF